ncbi:MAG: DnaD domain protein [Mycoplasmatota bacterium]
MDLEQLFLADTFIVINNTIIDSKSEDILIKLYQPIIGVNAIGLYKTLISYLDIQQIMSNENTHQVLVLSTKLKLESILKYRKILEAIGLLKTYLKKDAINSYVYELHAPLSASEFLKHPILNAMFINNTDQREYKRIVNYFKQPKMSLASYNNISEKFNNIFTVNQVYETENIEIKKKNTLNIDINYTLDIVSILNLFPDELLNKKTITKETLELINRLSFLYAFSDSCLEQIIRSSLTQNKTIDKKSFETNCLNFYKFENKGKLPNVIFKNQPENLRKENKKDTMVDKVIHTYEVTSPYIFLKSKLKGAKLSQNDLEILIYLSEDMKLNAGVINVLIDYVLRVNNNKLIKKFVGMVATQWKLSDIKTVEEAMELSKREIKQKKKVVKKEKKEQPAWLDKKIDEKNDPLKQKELEDMLSKYS